MTYEMPMVLTGDKLSDALGFVVTGPGSKPTATLEDYELSARAATAGLLQWLQDLVGAPGRLDESIVAVSSTYPARARLVRTGSWYSTGTAFDWDEFLSRNPSATTESAASNFGLWLNANDHLRMLYGPVWGPLEAIQRITVGTRPPPAFNWRDFTNGPITMTATGAPSNLLWNGSI